jgi:Holliday junction resolvase RusA-like endonuclease
MTTMTIPGVLPGMNEIVEAARGDKYASSKQKKEYTDIVAWTAKAARIPHMERIDITFRWYEPNKRRDKDNITAGAKFVMDGLVKAGIIKNDGWAQIGDISHLFDVDRHNPRVEVEITGTEEARDS